MLNDLPMYSKASDFKNAVLVEFWDGRWYVTIIEGDKTEKRDFEIEAHAAAFADGQRVRLGIYRP